MGIESSAITLPGSGYNPFTAVSARRRLAQTLQAWRATALIIETGEGMDLAARAAAQAGVAGIFPLLPPLESGAPANPRIAANVSWRHAFSLASAVFVQTPNDARLLAGPLAKLRVPQHQLPAASLDLARLQAQALPMLDLGFVFFGLDCGASDASPAFADAVAAFGARCPHAKFRLAQSDPSTAVLAAQTSARLETTACDATSIQDQLLTLAQQAHVVVIDGTSAYQTLLLVLALALGRPVLLVDDVAHRNFIDVGVNGWLVPRDDVTALADCMASILKRPDLLPGMARAARLKAERRFDEHSAMTVLSSALGISDLRVR